MNFASTSFSLWNRRFPTFGILSAASFLIAVITGIPLAIYFDVSSPFDSLQLLALQNPPGQFFRSLHYWSGQLFLWFTLAHILEYLLLSRERKLATGIWLRLVFSILLSFLVMLTGFILKGDEEGRMALQIFGGLIDTLPFIAKQTRTLILGGNGDFQVIYMHHMVTTSIFLWVIIIEHARKIWPSLLSYLYSLSVVSILSVFLPAGLAWKSSEAVKGPWYFIGLQELLHWFTNPLFVIAQVLLFFGAFTTLPWLKEKQSTGLKWVLLILIGIYILLTMNNWVLRDASWNSVLG